jgi:hypothetical protein
MHTLSDPSRVDRLFAWHCQWQLRMPDGRVDRRVQAHALKLAETPRRANIVDVPRGALKSVRRALGGRGDPLLSQTRRSIVPEAA